MQEKSTRNKYLEVCLILGSAVLTLIYLRWGMPVRQAGLNMLMGALLGSFPLLFVTKIYGLHKSMAAYVICLFLMLFFYGKGMLLLVYPLAAMLLCSLLSAKGWLDSLVRMVCAAVFTCVPMGILVVVLEYVTTSGNGVDSLADLLRPMVFCLPQFVISYFFVYVLSSLFLSKGYIRPLQAGESREYRKGSLRTRTTAFFIGGFFLLAVVSAVAANAMLPYFFEITGVFKKGYGMAGNDAFVPALPVNGAGFFWEYAPVVDSRVSWGAFDLALFLHLCLFLVPLVVLADWLMQRNVLTPVRVMDYGLEHYLELVKDDRAAAAKYMRELVTDTGDELESLLKNMQKAVAEMESYDIYVKEHQQYWENRCAERASAKAVAGVLQVVEQELGGPLEELQVLNAELQISSETQQFGEIAVKVQEVTETLSKYMKELMDASALGAGKLVIESYEYGFAEMLGEAAVDMAKFMQMKNLEFEVSVDEGLPAGLYGDERRISQIIQNILAYTAQYTEEGNICLGVRGTLEEDLACLHFEIDDTVNSMAEMDMSRLVLAETSLKGNDIQKTGVSLYVAKCLLEMMGSKLHVASVCDNGVAKKVLFYFDLWQKITDARPIGKLEIAVREPQAKEPEAGDAQTTEIVEITPEEMQELVETVQQEIVETSRQGIVAAGQQVVLEMAQQEVLGIEGTEEKMEVADSRNVLQQLPEIEGLDWNVAWMHMQDEALMARAVVGFIKMIPVHGKQLEDCYDRLPWKNAAQDYYEQIRWMRKDAETVGIYTLAGMAGTLEEAARERKLDIIWAMNGIFLKTWYSYDKKLRRMIEEVEELEEI